MSRALLVIDLQEGYIEKYPPLLLTRINERIREATIEKEIIVYVKNTKKLRSGRKTNSLAENLKICSGFIICKETASAFSNDDLQGILLQNQVTEIEIVGIDGNSCVANTAIDSMKYGYKTILHCEYIGVQNVDRFAKKKVLLSEKGIIIK